VPLRATYLGVSLHKIFLNLDLLLKFRIGNDLSEVYIIYYTIILKDKFSSAFVALLLYNCT